jgi:hypothetical protein
MTCSATYDDLKPFGANLGWAEKGGDAASLALTSLAVYDDALLGFLLRVQEPDGSW